MFNDIVISGLGVVSPIGVGEERFWDSLLQGLTGAAPIQCLDTSELPRHVGCEVKEPLDISVKSIVEKEYRHHTESMGRAAHLAVVATDQALVNAGLHLRSTPPPPLTSPHAENGGRACTHQVAALPLGGARISIIVGTTMGETEFIEDRLGVPDEQWLTEEHVARILAGRPGSIAVHVAHSLFVGAEMNERGVRVYDLYGACAAGNMALAAARQELLDGRCDLAIAGGSDAFSRLAFMGFMRLRVMSEGVCRPFDESRDGLLVGEGAAMFVLERESSARARGASIRGRIVGAHSTSENYHPTRPHPDGDGLLRAVQGALHDARVGAEDIDYVCAHGTGTPQNDAIEVAVMNDAFPKGVPFSSIKALTGHTMGAAAAMEAVACILALQRQMLIPTWHLDKVLQPCTGEALCGKPRPGTLGLAMNNSAGFGGYNSSVIFAPP